MKKRIISLIVTLFILMVLYSSCSEKSDIISDETTTVVDITDTEETELEPDIPEDDFDGYEFKILMKGSGYAEWASQDIYVEMLSGEVINDAVFNRNMYVESKYNVTIKGIEGNTDMAQNVIKSVAAGDDAYDVVTANMYDTSSLATQKQLIDLKEIPYLDFEKVWWDQRANSDLSINNKLYMTVSDLLTMPNDATWLVLFNKDLLEEYNLISPYQLVKDDLWYFNTMVEMTKGVSRDLNGDGVLDEHDVIGHISQSENAPGFLLGFGETVISKDKDDLPYLSFGGDRLYEAFEKVYNYMTNREYSINFQELQGYPLPFKITQQMFEENRGLFKTTAIQLVIRMRNMNTDFGIVPMPKYDSTQETYYNFVHPTASCISVPTTNSDTNRTGIILEALSAKSYYTLRNAYYDISLNNKFLRDEESIIMLDIILATRIYDLSQIYNWNNIGFLYHNLIGEKNNNLTSRFASMENSVSEMIGKTIEAYTE